MGKVPSFRGLAPGSLIQSRSKSSNRARNTQPELLLRRQLWAQGARYVLSPKEVAGRPDIVFHHGKVAVFCDGDFWHGRNWSAMSEKLLK